MEDNMILFKFNKDSEGNMISEFGYDGTLLDMCDGIATLIQDVLENFADKHPSIPKEQVADIVKRKVIEDVTHIVDSKYNIDDLFERIILESDKTEKEM